MLRCFDRHKWLWATHVWNMYDFAADARDQGGEPGMNHKGLVTFDRKTKKDSFYIYKAWWSDEPFVHICSKRYADRTENEIEVKVYSNQKQVSLYVNGEKLAEQEGSQVLPICAKLEADIAELDDPDEKAMFMEELGLQESGLDRLIQCSYALLGLISFLTAGSDECRAWTIKKGTKAPQAAGKIHSDFERGFIRAEVIAFDDLKACGTLANAKAKGLLRSEGKEYVMQDGDVVNFLFNV